MGCCEGGTVGSKDAPGYSILFFIRSDERAGINMGAGGWAGVDFFFLLDAGGWAGVDLFFLLGAVLLPLPLVGGEGLSLDVPSFSPYPIP